MAVTQSGVRLYFSSGLQLSHVRMPPAARAGLYGKMSHVRLCCESRGSVLLVCGTSVENQALYTLSPDAFLLPELVETLAMSWTHDNAWFLVPLEQGGPRRHASLPLLQTQHLDAPRRFLLVSVASIVQLELPSPIDHLRDALERTTSPQSAQIRQWSSHYGPDETLYAALVLASDKRSAPLAQRATELVLCQLNEAIRHRSTAPHVGNPLHAALSLYAARILRPLWDSPIAEERSPGQVSPAISHLYSS